MECDTDGNKGFLSSESAELGINEVSEKPNTLSASGTEEETLPIAGDHQGEKVANPLVAVSGEISSAELIGCTNQDSPEGNIKNDDDDDDKCSKVERKVSDTDPTEDISTGMDWQEGQEDSRAKNITDQSDDPKGIIPNPNPQGVDDSESTKTEENAAVATPGVDALCEQESDMDCTATDSSYYFWKYEIPLDHAPTCLVVSSKDEFTNKSDSSKKGARYLKGCKWAPDGSCLLSNSDDDNLRLFNFPSSFSTIQDWTLDQDQSEICEDWHSVLKVKEGGLIYDFCWYPLMSSMDPVSSCFISSSSQAPVHLWDAFTGKLRASYQPINHLEQLVSPFSLTFDATGEAIYCGFEKCIRIFNITRPGKECTVRSLKNTLSELNQYGIIANIAINPSVRSMYAVGTFDKTVGLYYDDGSVICLLQGHYGGITHMKFSNDGLKLFTGGRKDSRLICWDLRNMGEEYKIFEREVKTHQRIYFDITPNDRYIISGGTDGNVRVWDLFHEEPCPHIFQGNNDCLNGISINPYVPLLATSSGQRHFLDIADDSDDELFVKTQSSRERSCDIKLWKLT